jgi:hypothetical protein
MSKREWKVVSAVFIIGFTVIVTGLKAAGYFPEPVEIGTAVVMERPVCAEA